MKNFRKLLIILLIVFAFAITLSACDNTPQPNEGLEYELLNDTYSVKGIGTCTDTNIVIPSTHEGKPVTHIGQRAFANLRLLDHGEYSNIKSIVIPNSITSIGKSTFSYCTSLTSITIPNSVTNIGESAFNDCDSLASITIPDSVTSIGFATFYSCNGLTSVTIGNGVKSIGNSAFCYCDKLTSITIPQNVTSIDNNAFEWCYRLVEIYNKSSIDIVAGSDGNGYVGYYAKNVYTSSNGSKLTTTADGFVLYDNATLVQYVGNQTDITIPDGLTSIIDSAFYRYNELTSITIPDGLTNIGESAFYQCSNLTSITIPNSVKSIGERAFKNCYSLESITIPNSVTSIGDWAFSYCGKLKNINFNGTKIQWNFIEKGFEWNEYTSNFIVHCTDGDLDMDGNEI